MSDDEDYMSDAFLSKIPDTRPGLVPRHVARKHQQEKKEKTANDKNKQKPRSVLEKEKREEGLGSALTANNKGFSMLQKMGFKPGMVLGKSGTGRKDPVPVEVKLGRGGLGHESEQKRQKEYRTQMYSQRSAKRQKLEADHKQSFLRRLNEKMANKTMEKDLYKSQKVCEQLDSQLGIKEPHELFFWPVDLLPNSNSEKELEETSLEQPDQGYSDYIDDDDDSLEEDDDDNEEQNEFEDTSQYTTEEKLEVITLYLRTKHKYCIWCGIKYTGVTNREMKIRTVVTRLNRNRRNSAYKEDLHSNCPGPMAELHEDMG